MNPWLQFVLAALATWRVTHLLANEDGPADVIFRLRRRLGESVFGQLMDCFHCLSLWVAAVAAFAMATGASSWVLCWLALSGAACLLEAATKQPLAAEADPHSLEGHSDVLR